MRTQSRNGLFDGNEEADKVARQAVNNRITEISNLLIFVGTLISTVLNLRELELRCTTNDKWREVKSTVPNTGLNPDYSIVKMK